MRIIKCLFIAESVVMIEVVFLRIIDQCATEHCVILCLGADRN